MPGRKNINFGNEFLRCLSRIKGWSYSEKIEKEKQDEIKEFINDFIFKEIYGAGFNQKITFKRINYLVNHPLFKPHFKSLLYLLDASANEIDFNERFKKANTKY